MTPFDDLHRISTFREIDDSVHARCFERAAAWKASSRRMS